MKQATNPEFPYGRQLIEEDDVEAVLAVLRGEWLTTGPSVVAFEEAVRRMLRPRHAVSCSSGTAALHLAALALGLGPEDAVIVPSVTFVATANAVRYVGAEVVFSDVDPETGLMGETELSAALDRSPKGKVKAVFLVHLNGQCASMERLAAVAGNHDLLVVEDACHALGATYDDAGGEPVSVGSCKHSDMAVFSFHPVKTVTMGEGGMVTTNDRHFYDRLLRFRNHGITREADDFQHKTLALDTKGQANPWYYELQELGYNYRASDINCALGLSQLGKLSRFVAYRKSLIERYTSRLQSLAPLVRPLPHRSDCRAAWHLCVILIDFKSAGVERATVMRKMREDGIGTQVHYLPVHLQPYYRNRYGIQHFPGAERYYERTLTLPLHVGMTEQDVDRIVEGLARALKLS